MRKIETLIWNCNLSFSQFHLLLLLYVDLLWIAKVCNKIKIFIWQACKDILPTKFNLTGRKILYDVGCECCENGEESIDHVLLCYPYAEEVWNFTSLRNNMFQCSTMSFVDVVYQRLMIWNKRNEAHLGTLKFDLAPLVRKATTHALEYVEANFGNLALAWVCLACS